MFPEIRLFFIEMLQIGHGLFFTLYLISPINKGIQDMSMVKLEDNTLTIWKENILMINWEHFTRS